MLQNFIFATLKIPHTKIMFPNKLSPATIDGTQHFLMKHQLEKYQTPFFIPSNFTHERQKAFPYQLVRSLPMGITETSKTQDIDRNEGETADSIGTFQQAFFAIIAV
jgi:hypothetical protein